MGESKRRDQQVKIGDPMVKEVLAPGYPINIWLFTPQNIIDTVSSPGFSSSGDMPDWRGFRLAASMYQRFYMGEIKKWRCVICHKWSDGIKDMACIAIADRVGATSSDHGVAVALCLSCGSGDPDETAAMVARELNMMPPQEGHA